MQQLKEHSIYENNAFASLGISIFYLAKPTSGRIIKLNLFSKPGTEANQPITKAYIASSKICKIAISGINRGF